ncbi:hypothetical protein ACROYT_G016616 [Oculina patagonica]
MSSIKLAFLVINIWCLCPAQGRQILTLGAIFSENSTDLDERIFKFAIDSINKQNFLPNISLNYSVKYAALDNSFENIYSANQLLSEGVIAIIGPRTSTAVKAMHSLCSKFHIPQITATATDPDFFYNWMRYEYLMRMSPTDLRMSLALTSLIQHYKWERMGILTSATVYDMNALMDFKELATGKKWEILGIEHFPVTPGSAKVNATKELMNLREKGARVILLSCSAIYVPQVLEQAEQLDMIKEWVWILTDGAISKSDKDLSYKEGLVGLRMPVTGRGQLFDTVSEEWKNAGETAPINARSGRIYDAVLTVAKAIEQILAQNKSLTQPPVANGLCRSNKNEVQPWIDGEVLLSEMKSVKTSGIMSDINFSKSGSPKEKIYDVVNYQSDEGWVKVGEYNDNHLPRLVMDRKRPIVWLDGELDVPKLASVELKYRRIKVLIALSPPFVMKKENSTDTDSGLGYEGFCIDLLNELRKKLQFEYELELRESFGERQLDGTWNGIIGELTRKKASLAVSTLTISPEREKAVDFTQPYFSLGFKIIMKKTDMENKVNTWGFLDPFEKTLWIAIISSSVIVGIVVWIYDRLSPYGYYGRVVQSAEVTSEEAHAKNTLSFFHSFWAAAASYLEQGPDGFHPISHSGRATTLAWWFAISIFGATYTANLAAFLTINKYEHPIKTIEDLANQDRVKFGTAPGQLANMLKSASLPVYEKLWDFIDRHGTLEPNATYAIEKVRRTENYAFIWDSAVLEYEVQREPCNTLTLIERPFGSINYGFALPRHSPYTHNFSVAMLELQQEGFLERMTEKWFRSRSVCGAETQAAQEAAEEGGDQLHFSDMAGVFITLAVGVAGGMVVLFLELIYASYKDTRSRDAEAPRTVCAALWQRLHRTKKGFHDLYKGELPNNAENHTGDELSVSEPYDQQLPPLLSRQDGAAI